MSKIQENIRMLRIKAKLTQAQLAREMNIKQYNISDYETGRIEPNIDTLSRLADIFNVSIDTLVGREPVAEGAPLKADMDEDIREINESMENLSLEERKQIVKTVRFLAKSYNK